LRPRRCDERGYPRYWASVWLTLYGSNLSDSTLDSKLAVIEQLYRLTEELLGADRLDHLLAEGNLETVQPVLDAFFVLTRNKALMSGTNGARDWDAAHTFITQLVGGIAARGSPPAHLSQAATRLDWAPMARLAPEATGRSANPAGRARRPS
jgi:hypothetical protein